MTCLMFARANQMAKGSPKQIGKVPMPWPASNFDAYYRDGKSVWVKILGNAGAPEHIRIIAQNILT